MTRHDANELANTQAKLRELQAQYEELRLDRSETPRIRRLSMLSVKRLINQLTEEITRFESHVHHASPNQVTLPENTVTFVEVGMPAYFSFDSFTALSV